MASEHPDKASHPASSAPSEEFTLTIQDLARGGAGVSRDDHGRVIFVPFTAPGDRVRVRITEAKKNYAQGELLEVLEPAPRRQKPPCPVFGRCGGCQWQHLPYELQFRTKVQGVAHALKRVQVELTRPLEELPADRIWEYRNRVQLRGFRDELGFFAAGSNERVPTDHCPIARPEINAIWAETREEGRKFDRPYKVEVEVLPDGSVRKSWNAAHGAQGFRQVHDEQNEKLKGWVARHVSPDSSTEAAPNTGRPALPRLLDLYGGSGNLSLGLRGRFERIDCVDTGAPKGSLGPDYEFHRAPTASWIVKKASFKPAPVYDVAILDPPREGLAEDFAAIASSLDALGTKRLLAVGCDVDAWARDVSRFVRRGWRLEQAAVLDLFPQTPHVESLALLTR